MRFLPYLAFFLSGASSLIFQSIWTRMLHHVFGSTSIAMSTVLSVFMAGLGLGAWIFGKLSARIREPLQVYAIAELIVGAWGLLMPLLVSPEGWLGDVNALLRNNYGSNAFLLAFGRFACVFPLIIIPTTLMGATLPLLAKHFVRADQESSAASVNVGMLYAVNTLGAVLGTFVSGYWLMPSMGLPFTNRTACALNVLLAVAILVALPKLKAAAAGANPKADGAKPAQSSASEEAGASASGLPPVSLVARRVALVAFGVSGAAALAYEVVWTRALVNIIGGSIYSFTTILMTFLVGIALGSAITSGLIGTAERALRGSTYAALAMVPIAAIGLALEEDGRRLVTFVAICIGGFAIVGVCHFVGRTVVRNTAALDDERSADVENARPYIGLAPFLGPLLIASVSAWISTLGPMILCVIGVMLALFIPIYLLARSRVLVLGIVQTVIAAGTFVNYLWADELPFQFAKVVSVIPEEELGANVSLIQLITFLVSALIVLPATLGMGAMFPLTVRLWTSGGSKIAEDVGVVYTSNTIGSIFGAWLPGFVLLPLWGMERTLLWFGILVNLGAALALVIVGAEDVDRRAPVDPKNPGPDGARPAAASGPVAVSRLERGLVYTLAPVIPALAAAVWLIGLNPDALKARLQDTIRWRIDHMTLGVFRLSYFRGITEKGAGTPEQLIFHRDGLSTTVTVEKVGNHIALKNNGKVDASNGDDMPTQVLVAAYPLLLHPRTPQGLDVAVVGFGSGVSVGTTLQFPVRSVKVIELERAIPEASKFFAEWNHLRYVLPAFPFVKMDRLEVVNDDGRNYLASTSQKFDVIVSEPSNPWLTGVSDLFTTDHFMLARRRLRPGGIYTQWVQLYELSATNIKVIYRTFASQFKYVVVFAADRDSSDTVMLGSDSPIDLSLARISQNYALPGVAAELANAYSGETPYGVTSPHDILSRLLFGSRSEVMQFTQIEETRGAAGVWNVDPGVLGDAECKPPECRREPVVLNTDDNAHIEFAAPRDLIAYSSGDYVRKFYSFEWPYGKVQNVAALDAAGVTSSDLGRLAISLLSHGRVDEAESMIRRGDRRGASKEVALAAALLLHLQTEAHEPSITIGSPIPPVSWTRRERERFTSVIDEVKRLLAAQSFTGALAALGTIERPKLDDAGPSTQLLHAYLVYKVAMADDDGRDGYDEVINILERLFETEPRYVERHPEAYYFLARSHWGRGALPQAIRHMQAFVETPPRVDPLGYGYISTGQKLCFVIDANRGRCVLLAAASLPTPVEVTRLLANEQTTPVAATPADAPPQQPAEFVPLAPDVIRALQLPERPSWYEEMQTSPLDRLNTPEPPPAPALPSP